MQGRVSSVVLSFQIRLHRQNVGQRKLRAGKARPVERSAAPIVHIVNVHALNLREVVQRGGLVSLSGDVKHISSVNITQMVGGPVLFPQLDN